MGLVTSLGVEYHQDLSSDHIVDVFVGKAIIGQINETLIPAIALDIRKSAQGNV